MHNMRQSPSPLPAHITKGITLLHQPNVISLFQRKKTAFSMFIPKMINENEDFISHFQSPMT